MKVCVNYSEILQFVRKKTNIDLSRVAIHTHSNDTVNVSYQLSKWLPAVAISLSVYSLSDNIICFSYNCSPTLSLMLEKFISFLQTKIPKGIKIDIDNCNVLLNLSDINGINQVLDDISIDSLKFDGEAVKISACLR